MHQVNRPEPQFTRRRTFRATVRQRDNPTPIRRPITDLFRQGDRQLLLRLAVATDSPDARPVIVEVRSSVNFDQQRSAIGRPEGAAAVEEPDWISLPRDIIEPGGIL